MCCSIRTPAEKPACQLCCKNLVSRQGAIHHHDYYSFPCFSVDSCDSTYKTGKNMQDKAIPNTHQAMSIILSTAVKMIYLKISIDFSQKLGAQ